MIMRVIPRENPLLFELVVIVFPIVRIWVNGVAGVVCELWGGFAGVELAVSGGICRRGLGQAASFHVPLAVDR
jgi:hypothetical protein